MRALRTTAILKTDLRGSTPTFRGLPEADLDAMLRQHRAFVTLSSQNTHAAFRW
jgi:hypothetical protein